MVWSCFTISTGLMEQYSQGPSLLDGKGCQVTKGNIPDISMAQKKFASFPQKVCKSDALKQNSVFIQPIISYIIINDHVQTYIHTVMIFVCTVLHDLDHKNLKN